MNLLRGFMEESRARFGEVAVSFEEVATGLDRVEVSRQNHP